MYFTFKYTASWVLSYTQTGWLSNHAIGFFHINSNKFGTWSSKELYEIQSVWSPHGHTYVSERNLTNSACMVTQKLPLKNIQLFFGIFAESIPFIVKILTPIQYRNSCLTALVLQEHFVNIPAVKKKFCQ